MRRIAAVAVLTVALALTACGDDENASPAETQGQATTQTATTTVTDTDAASETPTAPESATIPSNGAPDEGIETRPGGPEESGGGY